jgi:hypothetical protein
MPRAIKFTEENGLPRPQVERTILHEGMFTTAYKAAFAMRIRIAFRMPVAGVVLRDELGQGQKDIMRD